MARKARISDKNKLAAALLYQMRPTADGLGWERIISHDEAKLLTADQIISLFHFDHDPIPEAIGGPTEPWNLTPRQILEHRKKTAKIDLPAIAKGKRIRAKYNTGAAPTELEKPSRKRSAKMPGSRGTPYKRKMNGKVVLREPA